MSDEARQTSDATSLYFVLAFAITWLSLLAPTLAALGLLEGPPDDYMALAPIAIFGPALAAVIVTKREGGWARVRALLAGLRPPRIHPLWYLLALTLPGLIYAVSRLCYGLIGDEDLPWAYAPTSAQQIIAMLLVPLGEEIGWRGYALARLQARYGALAATAILGVLWALWHLPMLISVGTDAVQLAIALPYFLAGNVMFTWFYNRTGGSLALAVLLHVGVHLDSPREGTGFVIGTLGYVALAALLLAFDRKAFPGPSTGSPSTGSPSTGSPTSPV